jgi:hypothetical protein
MTKVGVSFGPSGVNGGSVGGGVLVVFLELVILAMIVSCTLMAQEGRGPSGVVSVPSSPLYR